MLGVAKTPPPDWDFLVHFHELTADIAHSHSSGKMEKLIVPPKLLGIMS